MGEDDKSGGEKIEAVLTAAFALNRFSAYDQLRQRNWSPGETVDVFLAELRRLAELAGVDLEEVVLCPSSAAFRWTCRHSCGQASRFMRPDCLVVGPHGRTRARRDGGGAKFGECSGQGDDG